MKVCWFSTGVSSFVACLLAKDIDHIIYTHINSQHEDSIRFLHDCEKLIGRKIEILQSGKYKTVDDTLIGERYINGPLGAACTRELKRQVRRDWERKHLCRRDKNMFWMDACTYVWGYDINEKHRSDAVTEFMPDFTHEFPLIDAGLTKAECHDICKRNGLKRPAMYDMGYPNNNCIGCVKGGMGYWNKIRRDFPQVFAMRAKQEREIGHSCINGVFLDELDPKRGNMNLEVFEECGMACYIALDALRPAVRIGRDWNNEH